MVMSDWRKSSYSSDSANCVEVWSKPSRCGGGNCVEVARCGGVLVRDSKDPDGPRLRFDQGSWRAFLTMVKSG